MTGHHDLGVVRVIKNCSLKLKLIARCWLLFVLSGFRCFARVELETVLLVWSNANQSTGQPYTDTFPCGECTLDCPQKICNI